VRAGISRGDYQQAQQDAESLLALPTRDAERANDEALLGQIIERTRGPLHAAKVYRSILARYPRQYCASAVCLLREVEEKIEEAILQP
jgi:hypothetical protein